MLQQMQLVGRFAAPRTSGLSRWFGTALITAGILVHLGSAWRHIQLVRQLDRGDLGSRSLSCAVATALFLAGVGLAMAVYLLPVRNSSTLQSSSTQELTMSSDNGIVQKLVVDHSSDADKAGLQVPNCSYSAAPKPATSPPRVCDLLVAKGGN